MLFCYGVYVLFCHTVNTVSIIILGNVPHVYYMCTINFCIVFLIFTMGFNGESLRVIIVVDLPWFFLPCPSMITQSDWLVFTANKDTRWHFFDITVEVTFYPLWLHKSQKMSCHKHKVVINRLLIWCRVPYP